jgi:hypothetical protein
VKRLVTILNDELSMNLRITWAPLEQEVYVMRGEYKPAPVEKKPRRLEVSGPFPDFVRGVAGWIKRPVISEAPNPPGDQLQWHGPLEDIWAIDRGDDAESVERLLRHITAQTGFSFTKERREASVWHVERLK